MDLAWLWRSGRLGGVLLLGCLLRGAAAPGVLLAFGLGLGEAALIAVILIAVNPAVFASMASDSAPAAWCLDAQPLPYSVMVCMRRRPGRRVQKQDCVPASCWRRCRCSARIAVSRLVRVGSTAWSGRKKTAIALSLCSLVSLGSLVVDNSMTGSACLSEGGAAIIAALLALNVIAAPGLTWWGLKLADETHEGDEHG